MKKLGWFVVMAMFMLSCESKQEVVDKTVIPVGDAIGTGGILNLSDYAKSIEYVPLETNDSFLIANVGYVESLDNKYVIADSRRNGNSKCLLFDNKGKFIRQVGKPGNGPNEYLTIMSIDVNPDLKRILIDGRIRAFEYDKEGNLMKNVHVPSVPASYHRWSMISVDSGLYLSTLTSPLHRYYKTVLFQEQGDSTAPVRLHPNYFMPEKNDYERGSWGSIDGKMMRAGKEVRYWRAWDDTISTLGPDLEMCAAYVFDYGKYKAPTDWMFSPQHDRVTMSYVLTEQILETKRHLFLEFCFGKNAPESFEHTVTTGMGVKKNVVNVSVYGLFEKETGKLTLLKQSVKKRLGFRNDVDGGATFWPRYACADEKLVSVISAEDFLAMYEALKEPSPAMERVAEKLAPDDNPVLMVVTLK